MKFIQEITENHCFYFKEKTRFDYLTPTEYYQSFDWSHTSTFDDLFSGDDPSSQIFRTLFQSIPLNFRDLIPADQLPADMPQTFRELLIKPLTFYDFIEAMMDFTEQLTGEQKKFRELIQYLRKNSLVSKIYESMGIEGFNGKKITDREKLRSSYTNYFLKENQKKTDYDLFIAMYHGLEFFGFVKGNAQKQKMMNLINDGRHAFFGAHCDIVISRDADFLNKTKFIYEFLGINVPVIDMKEIETILPVMQKQAALNLTDLLAEMNRDDLSDRIIRVENENDEKAISIYLTRAYFSYFDMLVYVTNNSGSYYFYTKEPLNFSTGTLVKEIEYVTNRLSNELGMDANNLGLFDPAEIVDSKWKGRLWRIGDTIIELNYIHKMNLTFYPLQYLEKLQSRDSAEIL
jgi:hypothetical protein